MPRVRRRSRAVLTAVGLYPSVEYASSGGMVTTRHRQREGETPTENQNAVGRVDNRNARARLYEWRIRGPTHGRPRTERNTVKVTPGGHSERNKEPSFMSLHLPKPPLFLPKWTKWEGIQLKRGLLLHLHLLYAAVSTFGLYIQRRRKKKYTSRGFLLFFSRHFTFLRLNTRAAPLSSRP